MKLRKNQVQNNALFLILGLLVLSPVSSVITINILHFPLSLPELIALPILYLLKDKLKSIQFDKSTFLRLMILLVILIILSIINGEFALFPILSNARAWFWIFFTYSSFKKNNNITMEEISIMALGSLVGWFLAAYSNFDKMMIGALAGDELACTYGAMLAIPIFMSIVIEKKQYKLFSIGFVIMLGIMLLAGIRRAIFVVAFSLIVVLIISSLRQPKRIFRYAFGGAILVCLFAALLPMAEDYIGGVSVTLKKRVFDRTENFLTKDIASSDDAARLHNFENAYNNSVDFIFPRGLVDIEAQNLKSVAFMDFPLSQLLWIFSLLGTIIIVAYYIRIMFINARYYYQYKKEENLMVAVSLIVMASLLFLEGTFLAFPYAAPYTGFVLGQSVLYSKKKNL